MLYNDTAIVIKNREQLETSHVVEDNLHISLKASDYEHNFHKVFLALKGRFGTHSPDTRGTFSHFCLFCINTSEMFRQ